MSSGDQMQQQFQQAAQKNGSGSQHRADSSAMQVEMKSGSQRITKVANGLVDTFV